MKQIEKTEAFEGADRLPVRVVTELGPALLGRPGGRALQLYAEAKLASFEHLKALQAAIGEAHGLAQVVVDGGDLYAAGVRDLAKRLAEDLFWRANALEALRLRLEPVPVQRERVSS